MTLRKTIIVLVVLTLVGVVLQACMSSDEVNTQAPRPTPPPNADENINTTNRGEWNVRCAPNPDKQVDPIISPGVEPSMHNHSPGGGEMSSTANFDSLMAGTTSCRWARDAVTDLHPPHSLMWVPVLRQDGVKVPIQTFIVYYRLAKGHTPGEVKPFPPGLELFAGPQAKSPDGRTIVDWGCGGAGGGDLETRQPHNCDPDGANNFLKTRITFPSCSDGRLRSDDHRSHLSYPDFTTGCDADHPIQLPMIMLVVQYQTASAANLKLSSYGMVDINGETDNGTKTQHGDYIAAWDEQDLQNLTDQCINAQVQCGAQGLPN